MPRRPVTSMDPWQAEQDELDRIYEQWPANERPLFPPSPGLRTLLSPTRDEEHRAPSPWMTTGLGAVVPGDEE